MSSTGSAEAPNALAKATPAEFQALVQACRSLPPATRGPRCDDFIENLLLTVLDYQMLAEVVDKALRFFRDHHAGTITGYEALCQFLDAHPDDTDAAVRLWGYRFWKRVGQLRALLSYFGGLPDPVKDQEGLRHWVRDPRYAKFEGKVKGPGYAIHKWLTIRCGVESVKPDLHIRRYVEQFVSRRLTDTEVVVVLERVAADLDLPPSSIDAAIWWFSKARAKAA